MINTTPTDTTDEVEELFSDIDLEEIKRKSITGVISFFFRSAFLQLLGFGTALVLSAFLSPEDFGVYGFVIQIIGLLIFFSDIGLAAALIQKKESPSLDDYKTAFTLQQILSWIILGVIIAIVRLGIISDKVGPAGDWILISLGLAFPLATLKTIPSIILERKLEFNKLVVPQIFEQIVFNSILVWLAWKGYGVMAYSYAIIFRSIIGVVVIWLIQPWKIGFGISRKSLKTLLSFGVKFQLNDFLARIKDQLYFLVLALFMPIKDFGYLQWSKNWSMYPYNLTVQNVMAITFPTFSRLQNHKQVLSRAIEKSIFFISTAIFPILTGMCLFIWPLTEVVERYHKWQPSRISFILFALSIGWAAISTPLVNTLNAIGKINQSLKLMTMWTLLTWILTPPLMIKFGFTGVAMAAFIISWTSYFSVWMVKKEVKIRMWMQVWPALVSSMIMAGFGILMMNHWSTSLSEMIKGMVVVGIVYVFSIFTLSGRRLKNELAGIIHRPKFNG